MNFPVFSQLARNFGFSEGPLFYRLYEFRDEFAPDSPLQRRVHVSRDFALPWREAGFSRGCAGPTGAARAGETGIARCMAPTGENISVGPNSSTAASMRRWLNEL